MCFAFVPSPGRHDTGRGPGAWEPRPYERNRCVEHVEDVAGMHSECCARPTGVDTVAPPEILRNAQPANVQAAPNSMGEREKTARPLWQYKGRSLL
jgi:hypothetical protein